MLTTHKIPRTFTRGIMLAVLLCMVLWEIGGSSGSLQVADAQHGHGQSDGGSPLLTAAHAAGRVNALEAGLGLASAAIDDGAAAALLDRLREAKSAHEAGTLAAEGAPA